MMYDVSSARRSPVCSAFSLSALVFGVWSLVFGAPSAEAQFGVVDPSFSSSEFKNTVFPIRVISDHNGGLLWSFVNGPNLSGANGQRLGGLLRTSESGALDTSFATGPVLVEALGTAVQSDGNILVGGRKPGDVG